MANKLKSQVGHIKKSIKKLKKNEQPKAAISQVVKVQSQKAHSQKKHHKQYTDNFTKQYDQLLKFKTLGELEKSIKNEYVVESKMEARFKHVNNESLGDMIKESKHDYM